MPDIDIRLTRLIALREEGQHADALVLLQQLFAEAEQTITAARTGYFMLMLEWKFLAELHAPAQLALRVERDEQIRRLRADAPFQRRDDGGAPQTADRFWRTSRFSLIVEMNETLDDARSTAALFAQLDASAPELARQNAGLALPAVVEAGNFALAERYLTAPLAHLGMLNTLAASEPLFPATGAAPRLAAELTNLVKDVRIAAAVLRGQDQAAKADALCADLLAGLANDAMRALAQRELDAPGSIITAIVKHRMDQDQQEQST